MISSSRQRSTATVLTTVDAVSEPGETATEKPLPRLVPDPNGASHRGKAQEWRVMGLVIGMSIFSSAVVLGQLW